MPEIIPWTAVPFHFWSVVFFWFGCIVGSLLNVCIHRMPRGESIVTPRSRCPHCQYSIPWFLNIPLVTWLYLGGKCRNCKAPISFRYFLVELLTGVAFLNCWLAFGGEAPGLAIVNCALLAGFIVATFIDVEHFIIPDEITLGGIVVGFIVSGLVPLLHGASSGARGLEQSFYGILVGAGLIYGILRLGKLLFGRQIIELAPGTKIVFTETALQYADQKIPFEELFYRKSDAILLHAKTLELVDRCYRDCAVQLSPATLKIGADKFDPETVRHMEAVTDEIVLPREAMGLGDVKFMAAIGAFLGWQAVIFSLTVSAVIGAIVGVGLIACRKQEWSSRLPYGPYIALAATIWMFAHKQILNWWMGR